MILWVIFVIIFFKLDIFLVWSNLVLFFCSFIIVVCSFWIIFFKFWDWVIVDFLEIFNNWFNVLIFDWRLLIDIFCLFIFLIWLIILYCFEFIKILLLLKGKIVILIFKVKWCNKFRVVLGNFVLRNIKIIKVFFEGNKFLYLRIDLILKGVINDFLVGI